MTDAATGLMLDLSNNNGAFHIALAKQRHADLKAIAAKLDEGATFVDSTFAGFFAQAQAAGLVCLPYCFGRPESQPGYTGGVMEAQRTLKLYQPYVGKPLAGMPVLDYESVPDAAFVHGWVVTVRRALPHGRIIVYASASRIHELASLSSYGVTFWVADYGVADLPALGVHVTAWQYTDHFPAYPGATCDASHLYVSPAELLIRGKQPVHYDLVATVAGKPFARIRYGGGRVRAFLKSRRLVRAIGKGARVILRRQKASA